MGQQRMRERGKNDIAPLFAEGEKKYVKLRKSQRASRHKCVVGRELQFNNNKHLSVCLSWVLFKRCKFFMFFFSRWCWSVGRSIGKLLMYVPWYWNRYCKLQQTTVSRKWTHSSKTYPRRRNFVESIWIGKFRFRCFCLFFPFVVCVARTFSFESSSKHYNSDFVSHVHFV